MLPGVRVSAPQAPGLVVEASPLRIRVAGRRVRRGERFLLRPGESARVGDARIEASAEDRGTASLVRAVLRTALRGLPVERGPHLLALAGPLAGRRFAVHAGILGRGPRARVRLDDPSVSREHARVTLQAGRVLVEDLRSRNGSWIGRRRLRAPRLLEEGRELRAGATVLALALHPSGPEAPDPSTSARPPGRPPVRRVRHARVLLAVAALAGAAAALLSP